MAPEGADEIELAPRIVASKGVRFGRPTIRGTRVPVEVLLGQLAAGQSFDDVMDEYGLEREDILAALAYAAATIANDNPRDRSL